MAVAGFILWAGFALASGNTYCVQSISTPMISIGFILLVVSILGLIGSCCRINTLLAVYLVILFLVTVSLVVFTVFAIVVASKGSTSKDGKLSLDNYSNWLQKKVQSNKNWFKIKACLQESELCLVLSKKSNMTEYQLFHSKLSSIQDGCCNPSKECGFTYVRPTMWNTIDGNFSNPDCKKWSNNPKELCYNCESCKVGFLKDTRISWLTIVKSNAFFITFLFVLFVAGFIAFKRN
ncbi:tetraspanin-8 [Jatropha curcas]|nr:tetraspanin-8 [Jatropha curcas]